MKIRVSSFLVVMMAIFAFTLTLGAQKHNTPKTDDSNVTAIDANAENTDTTDTVETFSVMSVIPGSAITSQVAPISSDRQQRPSLPIAPPKSTPAPVSFVPEVSGQVLAAMQAIIAETKAVPSGEASQVPLAQPAQALKRGTFQRRAFPAEAQVHALGVATGASYSDPVGYQLMLNKKYVGWNNPEEVDAWLRQDYPAGGVFFTLEIFTPTYGTGGVTFSIQGPVSIGSSTIGTTIPIYYRWNYPQGEGSYQLYVFFLGGDGSFRFDSVVYYSGAAPKNGQIGYHIDKAVFDPNTWLYKVKGSFPRGVRIYGMTSVPNAASWSGESYYSFDGEHLYHQDAQTGAYFEGIWGISSEGDDEASVLLWVDEPGNSQFLTLNGVFIPGR